MILNKEIVNSYGIKDYLGQEFDCNCGKKHSVEIKDIIIEKNAVNAIPELLSKYGYKKPLILVDTNTYRICGQLVENVLENGGLEIKKCMFECADQLVPDEKALVRLLIDIDESTDIIIAVGSGTINDLARYTSFKLRKPYMIIATAPSMDGYASTVSPLIINNLKTTYEAIGPQAIIGDIDILKSAPMEMILAGLGDILGKYTSLCDWELGRIINNEYYCENVIHMVRSSIKKCVENVEGIKNREEKAIANLMEGLVLSGIAMSFVGNSRPASGAEHHIAHFWEMMFLFEGKKAVLHGTKVGITSIVISKIYEELAEDVPNFENALQKINSFKENEWTEHIKENYKDAANEIIQLSKKDGRNSGDRIRKRIEVIKNNWQDIVNIIRQVSLPAGEILKIMKYAGAPINPVQVGVNMDTFYKSVVFAKEIRSRYTVLQLLRDIGMLENYADKVGEYFLNQKALLDNEKRMERSTILKRIKCYVLDMDGTFYLGNKILDGSIDFINCLKSQNKEFYVFTNNSSRNAEFYREKLTKMGWPIEKEKIFTSNQVIINFIKERMPHKKVFLLGTNYLKLDFVESGIELVEENPDLIVVGFDTTLEYPKISRACHYIRNGVPVLGVNPDLNCPVEQGFIPDCGSICSMIKASTGVDIEFFGKPSKHTLKYVLGKTGFKENEICFVGDRLYTDIAIGQNNDVNTILVLSGETKEEDLGNSNIKPTLVYKSLKHVKEDLEEVNSTIGNFNP